MNSLIKSSLIELNVDHPQYKSMKKTLKNHGTHFKHKVRRNHYKKEEKGRVSLRKAKKNISVSCQNLIPLYKFASK